VRKLPWGRVVCFGSLQAGDGGIAAPVTIIHTAPPSCR
jgi:hypothetical protein